MARTLRKTSGKPGSSRTRAQVFSPGLGVEVFYDGSSPTSSSKSPTLCAATVIFLGGDGFYCLSGRGREVVGPRVDPLGQPPRVGSLSPIGSPGAAPPKAPYTIRPFGTSRAPRASQGADRYRMPAPDRSPARGRTRRVVELREYPRARRARDVLRADSTPLVVVRVTGVDEHTWRDTRRGDTCGTVILDLAPIRNHRGSSQLLDLVAGRSKHLVATRFHVASLGADGLNDDHRHTRRLIEAVSASLLAGVPKTLEEPVRLGRTLRTRSADMLAGFGQSGTSNGLAEGINGGLSRARESALGYRNRAWNVSRETFRRRSPPTYTPGRNRTCSYPWPDQPIP